jgi:transposase
MNPLSIKPFWLGIDVGKSSFCAALAPEGARPDCRRTLAAADFESTPAGIAALVKWAGQGAAGALAGVVMEATGVYSRRLAEALAAAGLPCASIVNPARPLSFARSLGVADKTDRSDALTLALYGAIYTPSPTLTLSAEHLRLRQLWRLREDEVESLKAARSRLDQADDPFVRAHLKGRVGQIERGLKRIEDEMTRWIGDNPDRLKGDYDLLLSVPGVGRATAWMLLAELGDLRRWSRAQIVSYAGLYPRRYQSGTSVCKKPRLVKGGGHRIRKGLFMAALAICRSKTPLRQFRERLLERSVPKMAALGAMMRKLLLQVRSVVCRGTPYQPDFNPPKKSLPAP